MAKYEEGICFRFSEQVKINNGKRKFGKQTDWNIIVFHLDFFHFSTRMLKTENTPG